MVTRLLGVQGVVAEPLRALARLEDPGAVVVVPAARVFVAVVAEVVVVRGHTPGAAPLRACAVERGCA